jgi:hypothetical protein
MNDPILDPLGRDSPLSAGFPPDLLAGEVVEVPMLLPGWQMSALERAAHNRGLTAGEMVRHLLRDFFRATLPARGADPTPGKVKVG